MSKDNEYMRNYMRVRYHKRRARFISELGGVCVACGTTEELQFDHIIASTKEVDMSKILQFADEKVYKELAKCQLLCDPCHKEKSYREGDLTEPFQHGTLAGYRYCSCEDCRRAKREYMREYRNRKKSKLR